MQATGSPNDLANKLSVSRRCLFTIINLMKSMNAPIKFCTSNQSYYYERECHFAIGFIDKSKIIGGLKVKKTKSLQSADFLHSTPLFLNQIMI